MGSTNTYSFDDPSWCFHVSFVNYVSPIPENIDGATSTLLLYVICPLALSFCLYVIGY